MLIRVELRSLITAIRQQFFWNVACFYPHDLKFQPIIPHFPHVIMVFLCHVSCVPLRCAIQAESRTNTCCDAGYAMHRLPHECTIRATAACATAAVTASGTSAVFEMQLWCDVQNSPC